MCIFSASFKKRKQRTRLRRLMLQLWRQGSLVSTMVNRQFFSGKPTARIPAEADQCLVSETPDLQTDTVLTTELIETTITQGLTGEVLQETIKWTEDLQDSTGGQGQETDHLVETIGVTEEETLETSDLASNTTLLDSTKIVSLVDMTSGIEEPTMMT